MPDPIVSVALTATVFADALLRTVDLDPIDIPPGASVFVSTQVVNPLGPGNAAGTSGVIGDTVEPSWTHGAIIIGNGGTGAYIQSEFYEFIGHPGGNGVVITLSLSGGDVTTSPIDVIVLIVTNINQSAARWTTACFWDDNPDAFQIDIKEPAPLVITLDTSTVGGSPVTQAKELLLSILQGGQTGTDPTPADTFSVVASYKGTALATLLAPAPGDITSSWNVPASDAAGAVLMGLVFDNPVPPSSGGRGLALMGVGL